MEMPHVSHTMSDIYPRSLVNYTFSSKVRGREREREREMKIARLKRQTNDERIASQLKREREINPRPDE